MTSAIAAFGIQLQLSDMAATPTFATIAEVTNLSGPGLSLETADVTSHSSTGGWREFVGTVKDGGELTLDINYDPDGATHDASTGLIDELENKRISDYKILWPGGSPTWEFKALVTGFEPSAPFDDKLTASVTLKITGQPTLV